MKEQLTSSNRTAAKLAGAGLSLSLLLTGCSNPAESQAPPADLQSPSPVESPSWTPNLLMEEEDIKVACGINLGSVMSGPHAFPEGGYSTAEAAARYYEKEYPNLHWENLKEISSKREDLTKFIIKEEILIVTQEATDDPSSHLPSVHLLCGGANT